MAIVIRAPAVHRETVTPLHLAPNPQRGLKLPRWVWAIVLGVGALLIALAYLLGTVLKQSVPTPAVTTSLNAEPSLLRYTAQLTNQALSDKQRLLDAYAYTLGFVDSNDSLAKKQWLNSHGDLVSRLFEETWLVFLPSASSSNAAPADLVSWLLRPGQAAVATPLTGPVAGKFSEILAHKLTTSIEISYLVEQGQTRVVHASPALNKQGVPIAVLVALTPLSGYLSLDGIGCLNTPDGQYTLPLPSNAAVLGPFIINAHKQLLATSAGQDTEQLQALLNQTSMQWQAANPPRSQMDYALQWQRIPGTTWQMGLAIAQAETQTSEFWSGGQALSLATEDEALSWALLVLSLALGLGLLAWRSCVYQRSRTGPTPDSFTLQPGASANSDRLKSSHSHRHAGLTPGNAEQAFDSQGPPPTTPHGQLPPGSLPLSLSMDQLKHSRQCLVLLQHSKIQAMSQAALEFLQADRAQPTPRAIHKLLAQPADYERLRFLIGAAGQNLQPFSLTTEIIDGLGFRHVVYAQIYPPSADAPHQRLVVFEAEQARLARLCPANLLPLTEQLLNPICHLPTFAYWHALLAGQLRLSELQSTPPGYVLYLAIDGFASLSSAGSHAFSDEALRYTANALTNALSQLPLRHLLGHIHKEQFAVACFGLDAQHAQQLAKHLQRTIAHLQASYQGVPMLLSISVGLAALPRRLHALDAQLNAADLACFDAASKGIAGLEIAKPCSTTALA
ncbi:GGDEF domain-containing protein [Lampropedia aestuarii]|uniref:GGDEF domain-containing protein n=1 Tax=Lampropedia aestuarii TaxID=2562762 RepID=A0A4S5BUL8_9BURK|nr:GGDEF domain-containing protein [Lampropedia aestuarii]